MSVLSLFFCSSFISLLLLHPAHVQFLSTRTLGLRVPGLCPAGCFDCGLGRRCVSITAFHDGRPDCPDGSDEWCLPGFIKCGSYCVEPKYLGVCLFNPRCNGKPNQPGFCLQSKEKLCREKNTFPCKAYGECVPWSWVRDGQTQCIDGSDESDVEYISVLERGWRAHLDKVHRGLGNDTHPLPFPTAYPFPPTPPGNELEPFRPLSPFFPPANPSTATTAGDSDFRHSTVQPHPIWPGYGISGVTPIHPQVGKVGTEGAERLSTTSELPVIFIPGRWSGKPFLELTTPNRPTQYPGGPAIVHPTLIPFDYTPSQIIPGNSLGEGPLIFPPLSPLGPFPTRGQWSPGPWTWPPPLESTEVTTPSITSSSSLPLSTGITMSIHGHHGGRILTTSTTSSTMTTTMTSTTTSMPTETEEKVTEAGLGTMKNDTTPSTFENEKPSTVNVTETILNVIPTDSTTLGNVEDEAVLRCEKAFKEEIGEATRNVEIRCKCSAGQMIDSQGKCQEAPISMVAVNPVDPPCNATSWSRFDEMNLGQLMALKLKRVENVSDLCVVEAIPDGRALVRLLCQPSCDLDLVNKALSNEANISTGFDFDNSLAEIRRNRLEITDLTSEICEDRRLNDCHENAKCEPFRLSYRCTCKEGTNDTELTRPGRNCWGIPDEDNCILLFDVCLVFWALCLIGAIFLIPLIYMCISGLVKWWRKRKRKVSPNVAFNTKPTVINIDNFEQTNTARLLRQTLGPRAAGVLASGRALQNMQLKSILKPSDSGLSPLAPMEDVETEFEPITQPTTGASTTLPSPADTSPQATEPPSARAASAPPTKEQPPIDEERRSLHKSGSSPRLAELATSPPLIRSQSVVQQRVGSAQSAGAVVAGTAAVVATAVVKAQAQTAPASPVFSIRVPAASKTAPPTPQVKEEPPSFAPLSLASSFADLQRQDLISSPAPSLASRASRHGQPTIWETYRVLGDQYAKPESARPESSDSLDKLIKERYPTPPEENLAKAVAEKLVEAVNNSVVEPATTTTTTALPRQPSQSEKLAEMLGVSVSEGGEESKDDPPPPPPAQPESTPAISSEIARPDKLLNLQPGTLSDADEAALLALSAQGGLIGIPNELTTRSKSERIVRTAGAVEGTNIELSLSDKSSPTSDLSPDGRIKKGPTFTRKRLEELKKERSRLPVKKEIFMPKGLPHRKMPSTINSSRSRLPQISPAADQIFPRRPPRRVIYRGETSDEGSDMDAAINRFETALQQRGLEVPGKRKGRRRSPQRQLSSISEKSAEIAADEVLNTPDFALSAPTTMREGPFVETSSLLRSPLARRRVHLSRRDPSSDPDIPADQQLPTSSQSIRNHRSLKRSPDPPEIRRRGDRSRVKPIKMPPNLATKKSDNLNFLPSTTAKELKGAELAKERKMHTLSTHFHETTTSRPLHGILVTKQNRRGGGGAGTVSARECGTTCQWCHEENSDSSAYFMPGMRSRKDPGYYSARTHSISPERSIRSTSNLRGGSHYDLSLSPYFNPKSDSKKPHKEGLWWGHVHA